MAGRRNAKTPPMAQAPELTVVVPTRDEEQAVVPLYQALVAHLEGIAWEAVFVDDSRDATPARLRSLAATDARLRVRHRHGARGLGGAITAGLRLARGRYVCVLDADGQHPPDLLPRLLHEAREGADLVVASRFAAGGSLGDVTAVRQRVARCARAVARLLVPAARRTTDPLSGCFLARRERFDLVRLRPGSWKVLLELLATRRPERVADVAYHFAARRSGRSKLGPRAVAAFALHALKLAARQRDWRSLGIGLQYALAVRVGLLAATWITLGLPHAGHLRAPGPGADLWRDWAEWDGVWYERIAASGYTGRHAYAFFPLYPLLLRLAEPLARDPAAAGVLVSTVASVACFALLHAQVRRDHGAATAERAVRYLALFPTGFYLATAYTEATFLALALLALQALRRRGWGTAALAGAGAALTRNVGVCLALPAAWCWWAQRPRDRSGARLAVLGAPLGLAGFMAFSAWSGGGALAFFDAQHLWQRHLSWPWTTASTALRASLFGPHAAANAVDLAAVVAAMLALSAGRRWLHPTERLFAWAVLALTVAAPLPPQDGTVLLSATRLVLAAYPAFVVLARWGRHPAVDRLVSVAFPLMQAAAFVLFTHSYFVA